MGTRNAVIILFSLLASAAAQQPLPSVFKVEGTVINSSTGKPLSRALVQVGGRCAQLTGSEGEFSCDGIFKGWTQITVTKPGFFAPGAAESRSYSSLDVGPDTGKVLLKLAPEAVIVGHVTGSDGGPLEGAAIEVLGYVSRNGHEELEPRWSSPGTDEDGNFRVGNLAAGRYYVAVKVGRNLRGMPGARDAPAKQYPALVYYPGSEDLASATAVDILPGQRLEVSFSLSLVPAFKLTGRVVTGGECKQAGSPTMVGAADEGLFSADQFDQQAGTFEFRSVPAGIYTLRVSGMDQQDHPIHSDRVITVSQPVTGLSLALKPRPMIPVRIRTEFNRQRATGSCSFSTRTATGVEVHRSDCSDFPAANVEIVSVGLPRFRFAIPMSSSADPSTFEIQGVPAGKYRVHAMASAYRGGYVQSVRSGSLDLLREELVVPEEGSIDPIEVVVRDDSAAITVRIHGQSAERFTVLLVPEGGALEPRLVGPLASESQVTGLAPGTYKVLAFADLQGLNYAEPEVLARYLDQAASVTLSANNKVSVLLDVIHIGE